MINSLNLTPESALQGIEKTLGRLLKQATITGDEKAAARIQHVGRLTRGLYQQLNAVAQSAGAAIQTVTEQRDQMASELADLSSALVTDGKARC